MFIVAASNAPGMETPAADVTAKEFSLINWFLKGKQTESFVLQMILIYLICLMAPFTVLLDLDSLYIYKYMDIKSSGGFGVPSGHVFGELLLLGCDVCPSVMLVGTVFHLPQI